MWLVLAPIIARYGIEIAYDIWKNIQAKGEPTEEQWAALLAKSRRGYDQYIADAKARVPVPATPEASWPRRVFDGRNDYVLASADPVVDGIAGEGPLYEKVPADPDNLFKPNLEFIRGQATVPIMIPVPR